MTDVKALREALANGDAWIGQPVRLVQNGILTMGTSQDVATLRDLLDEVEALRERVAEAERMLAVKMDECYAEGCERETAVEGRDAAVAEVARLRDLLGCQDPVRCPACGGVRERAEICFGNCTHLLDGSEVQP